MNLCSAWRGVAVLALLLAPSLVLAQGVPLHQSGTVTPHHLLKSAGNGLQRDVGSVTGDTQGRGVSPFAITDSLGTGLCVNSAVTSGQYNGLCWGHDADGNGLITLDSFGGLADKALKFRINGNEYDFPSAGAGNGDVVGPNSSTVGNLAFYNSTNGKVLKDDGWTWDGDRIKGPTDKSITLQGAGVFQPGGTLGPYLFNDTAADTMSVIAQIGALPSGNATNFQIYPPQPGDKAYLNITAKASGGGEERLIVGTEGSGSHYVFSQVYTGTGVCANVDFLDGGLVPWFTLVCSAGADPPAVQLGNEVPLLGATAASGSQSLMVLDSALAMQLGQGSAITAIAANKHLTSVGSSPSLSSCGTTPAIASATDTKGTITIGTGGPTSCTVTFAAAYDSAPVVQLTGVGSGGTIFSVSSKSATNFVISGNGTDLSNKVVDYFVIQ